MADLHNQKRAKKKKRGRQFHIFVFVCVCVCIHVCVCVCVKERVEWCGTESATPFSFLSRKRYGEFIFSFLSFFPVCVCVCVTSLSCFFFSFSPFFTRAACAFWRGSARRCRAAGLRRSIPRLASHQGGGYWPSTDKLISWDGCQPTR